MNPFHRKKELKDIPTDDGYAAIKELTQLGWKIESEYSKEMFDKGIDMDGYVLVKENNKLNFEWDNWMEWTVEGKAEAIDELSTILTSKTNQAEPADRGNG